MLKGGAIMSGSFLHAVYGFLFNETFLHWRRGGVPWWFFFL